jgi:DNA modification methylase
LLEWEKAQMVFTDPPYNVPISGHVCGNGAQQHDEFKMASGEMSKPEFTAFLSKVFESLCNHTSDGSLHYICMDWRHMQELMQAGEVYRELKNLCVWNKTNGGMGSLYRSKHELVFVYKNGKEPHINNINLGKNGRYRTNVWDYAGVNTFENTEDLKLHPTVKPVALIQDAILDCTKRGQIVLDSFGGSGSTLIAAERAHRKAFLMELEPKYVDVIVRRYQELTGDDAVHADGMTFAQKEEARHVSV